VARHRLRRAGLLNYILPKSRIALRNVSGASLWVAVALFPLTLAIAQDGQGTQPGTSQPGVDMDRKARLAEPGAEHKRLDPLIGAWEITGQCWMKAGESPQAVTGTEDSEWVLGNRFVKCHFKGSKGGKSFEGIAISGYDNAQREYQTSSQDTECTAIKMETGSYEPSSKTFTYTGEFQDESGQTVRCRRLLRIDSNDQHTMTAYLTPSGQSEMKVAELTFKRTAAKATPKR
jgi:hypothetical protein